MQLETNDTFINLQTIDLHDIVIVQYIVNNACAINDMIYDIAMHCTLNHIFCQ